MGNEEERYTRGTVTVRAVMSLYEGAKTRVRVGLELSKEFGVKVGVPQASVLSPLVFAMFKLRSWLAWLRKM